MNKILVPIQNFSPLSLSASNFAVKFAKRYPTKILFLIFADLSGRENDPPPSLGDEPCRRQFDGLIQQARAQKIHLEIFYSDGEYLKAVSQFARDHNATEIIIALPQFEDAFYHKLMQDVNALRDQGENQIILVKPREEGGKEDRKEPITEVPYP